MRALWKGLGTGLRRFLALLRLPRPRRRPGRAAAAIAWPETRRDRGGNLRRYDPPPGMVYARQIAEYLGHESPETVLGYYRVPGPDGTTLLGGPPFPAEPHDTDGRNFFIYDEHFESYCSEAHARSIVERIRWRAAQAA